MSTRVGTYSIALHQREFELLRTSDFRQFSSPRIGLALDAGVLALGDRPLPNFLEIWRNAAIPETLYFGLPPQIFWRGSLPATIAPLTRTRKRRSGMRLYRGITKKYRPEEVGKNQQAFLRGTDFTDCPYMALPFARGSSGTLLVLEVPTDLAVTDPKRLRVTEEYWSFDGSGPKRYMVWGSFDEALIAEIPAKELRAQVRRKGVVSRGDEYKATILERYLKETIDGGLPQDLDRPVRGN